jgi:hypothetical protein
MKRCVVLLLGVVLGSGGPGAVGQEPAYQEELQFVRGLRARHYYDLALDYLKKLARNPSPELARELPLELALTHLDSAAEEPDSAKRLALYQAARSEFDAFLAKNPGHPRTGEAKLAVAHVAVQQGRTQLSRAYLQEALEGRIAEGQKARTLLVDAGKQLQTALTVLDAQVARSEGNQKKRLEEERLRGQLEVGINFFDQAQTYFDEEKSDAARRRRTAKIKEAMAALEKVANQEPKGPVTWQAEAWLGRCMAENGEPKKARQRFTAIREAGKPAAEGQRLARYFRLLLVKDSPEPEERGEKGLALLQDQAASWIKDYPAYLKTPEGYGVRFLLAETLFNLARAAKGKNEAARLRYLTEARQLLREVEQTENDFTDRARRLKLALLAEQGGFTGKVAALKTFDECFVRAQYEIGQAAEDARTIQDPAEREKRHKERVATILEALERGIRLAKAKPGTASVQELNDARVLLAFYCLGSGRLREAMAVGEDFARNEPRAASANLAALYALQAYSQVVARGEEALKNATGTLTDDEGKMLSPAEFESRLKADHDKMIALAQYVEERWPRDLAADLARHQIGLLLYRQKDLPGAVRKLSAITPAYPSYALSQYKLAEIALEADRDKAPPLPGDKPGDYRQRALAALEAVPEPGPDAEASVSHAYFLAKARLGEELFAARKFADMDRIARPLLQKLSLYHFDSDPKRDEAVRQYLKGRLVNVTLYAAYGLADTEFAAGHYARVGEFLDPLVEETRAGKLPELGKNAKLGSTLLGLALQANVQLGKMDRAGAALEAMQRLASEGSGKDAATDVLRQLGVVIREQMQEVRKKKDEENVKKAVAGFTSILENLNKAQARPSPEFTLLLAQNFASLEQHDRAVAVLEKTPPAEGDDKAYRASRLLLARELRHARQFDRARQLLDEIIGTREKPGWGQRNVDALMERVFLLEDAEQYYQAATLASNLVRQLSSKATTDNTYKDKYLETYFHLVRCFYKHARGMDDKAKREKGIQDAAVLIGRLEKAWENFGSETSKARFQELLDQEGELKSAYEKVRMK